MNDKPLTIVIDSWQDAWQSGSNKVDFPSTFTNSALITFEFNNMGTSSIPFNWLKFTASISGTFPTSKDDLIIKFNNSHIKFNMAELNANLCGQITSNNSTIVIHRGTVSSSTLLNEDRSTLTMDDNSKILIQAAEDLIFNAAAVQNLPNCKNIVVKMSQIATPNKTTLTVDTTNDLLRQKKLAQLVTKMLIILVN